MKLEEVEAIDQAVKQYKLIGHSSKFPMPISTAEALIKAAMRAAVKSEIRGRSFVDAIDGVKG